MGKGDGRVLARRVAVVVGSFFQVVAPVFAAAPVGEVSGEARTLVVPADYAFVIWGPIFLLSFAFAAYQALPREREDPLLGRVGWWIGGAFWLNGVWVILFSARQFLLSEAVFLGVFACLFVAYRRVVGASARRALGGSGRWLVALPLGLLFGWVTIANFAGIATTLVGVGLLDGGVGEASLGAVLLLFGGLVASALVSYGKAGPSQGYLAFAAAVLWGLAGIAVNQYEASLLTTGAAVVAAASVGAVVFGASGVRPAHRRAAGRSVRPGAA